MDGKNRLNTISLIYYAINDKKVITIHKGGLPFSANPEKCRSYYNIAFKVSWFLECRHYSWSELCQWLDKYGSTILYKLFAFCSWCCDVIAYGHLFIDIQLDASKVLFKDTRIHWRHTCSPARTHARDTAMRFVSFKHVNTKTLTVPRDGNNLYWIWLNANNYFIAY